MINLYFRYHYNSDFLKFYSKFIGVDASRYLPTVFKGIDLNFFTGPEINLPEMYNREKFCTCLFFQILFDQGLHCTSYHLHSKYFGNFYPKLSGRLGGHLSPIYLIFIIDRYSKGRSIKNLSLDMDKASYYFVDYYLKMFKRLKFSKIIVDRILFDIGKEMKYFLSNIDSLAGQTEGQGNSTRARKIADSIISHILLQNYNEVVNGR